MDKMEAVKAVNSGHKVSHSSFVSGEYMTKGTSRDIMFEDGVQCSWSEFFMYRQHPRFNSGWFLLED